MTRTTQTNEKFLRTLTQKGNKRICVEGAKGHRVGDKVLLTKNNRSQKWTQSWKGNLGEEVVSIITLRYYTLNGIFKNYHARVKFPKSDKVFSITM